METKKGAQQKIKSIKNRASMKLNGTFGAKRQNERLNRERSNKPLDEDTPQLQERWRKQ